MDAAWLPAVRAFCRRQDYAAARAAVEAAQAADPADRRAQTALAELCAAQGDRPALGAALSHLWHSTRSADGAAPALSFDVLLPDHADVQLRIRQILVSVSGNDRAQRAALLDTLGQFPFFRPPLPPAAHDVGRVALDAARLAPFLRPSQAPPGHLSLWQDWLAGQDLAIFRGECVFLSQAVSYDPSNFGAQALRDAYRLQAEHARAVDRLGAMDKLDDDGAFGCLRFEVEHGAVVSRDLLDSVMELNFLSAHGVLDPSEGRCLLDIGAGYGRLAHRFLTLFPAARVYALDALPLSSLLCAQYLHYRRVLPRAVVGGMDCLQSVAPGAIHCATNVHSWSEGPLASIEAWLDALVRLQVRFLFFVPTEANALSLEQDGTRRPILPAIAARGFRLVAEQPKYGVASSQALYPFVHYCLFERT